MIIGEAWGREEAKALRPFVGASGYELTRMLRDAGISRDDCFLTNVFNHHPPDNDLSFFCGPKSESLDDYPSLGKSQYVRKEFQRELTRLGDEILDCNPNIIVCCGNTPLWAMAGRTGISKLRGTTLLSTHCVSGYKLLPTYHPSAVLRQWELRPVTVLDLMKALRESAFEEIRRPQREIWVEPTIEDIHEFKARYISDCRILSVDIETSGTRITCIGFAPSKDIAIVIPFDDDRRKGRNYWETPQDESIAIGIIREILEDRTIPKVFQNGMYDIAFLLRSLNIRVYGAIHDTMLLHHALQPESLKGLGFLGSVYTDETSWKVERKGTATIKRDE